MDKRTLLAVVLSLAVLMGYQFFFQKPLPPAPREPGQNAGETAGKTEGLPQEIDGNQNTYATPVITRQKSLIKKDEDKRNARDIVVEGPMYTAIFNSRGANLKSFKLKNYRKDLGKDSPLVELVQVGGSTDYPLTMTFPESNINIPPDAIYESDTTSLDFIDTMGAKDLVFPGHILARSEWTRSTLSTPTNTLSILKPGLPICRMIPYMKKRFLTGPGMLTPR